MIIHLCYSSRLRPMLSKWILTRSTVRRFDANRLKPRIASFRSAPDSRNAETADASPAVKKITYQFNDRTCPVNALPIGLDRMRDPDNPGWGSFPAR